MTVVKFPKIFKPLDDPHRYKVLYGGRGSAKSWTVARKLLLRGLENPLRILCTRELQKSISQSVHKLLSLQIHAMGLQKFYTIHNHQIVGNNGTTFIFMGLQANPQEIKSLEGIDIAWLEEASNLTESSWEILDPTIRKEDSEIWMVYNTRYKFDTIHKMFVVDTPPPDSLIIKANYYDNPYFPEVLRKQMEFMKANDYEKYLHVWKGEVKSLASGAIFGKQITKLKKDKRLLNIPIQSNCPVHTFWDIGKNDATAIWFVQKVGMEFRFIDYYQNRLQDVEHYVMLIKSLDYNYAAHYLPHDADHDRLGMVRNIKEQFEDGGIHPVKIVPVIPHKNTAIELGRALFSQCYFHTAEDERGKRVEKGWECLNQYQYKYNDDNDVFAQTPLHNHASNGADAFMGCAQSKKKMETSQSGYNDWNTPIN